VYAVEANCFELKSDLEMGKKNNRNILDGMMETMYQRLLKVEMMERQRLAEIDAEIGPLAPVHEKLKMREAERQRLMNKRQMEIEAQEAELEKMGMTRAERLFAMRQTMKSTLANSNLGGCATIGLSVPKGFVPPPKMKPEKRSLSCPPMKIGAKHPIHPNEITRVHSSVHPWFDGHTDHPEHGRSLRVPRIKYSKFISVSPLNPTSVSIHNEWIEAKAADKDQVYRGMSLKRQKGAQRSSFPPVRQMEEKKVHVGTVKFADMSHRQRVEAYMLPTETKQQVATAFAPQPGVDPMTKTEAKKQIMKVQARDIGMGGMELMRKIAADYRHKTHPEPSMSMSVEYATNESNVSFDMPTEYTKLC